MGAKGPVPKRSDELMRRNKVTQPVLKLAAEQPEHPAVIARPTAPPLDEKWHASARAIYEALLASPTVVYMTAADWAFAHFHCEMLSRELKEQFVGLDPESGAPRFAVIPMKGASLSAHMKFFSSIGVSEAERRRMHVELQLSEPTEGEVDNRPDIVADRLSLLA